ncbi:MAG: hypothetical protein ACM3ZC_10570 [Bacteroidota bacterium]
MNRIECHFAPLRKFALSGVYYADHKAQMSGIRRHIGKRRQSFPRIIYYHGGAEIFFDQPKPSMLPRLRYLAYGGVAVFAVTESIK